jgi:uncharacterized secreted protein with C-terminal beta-propeller domain
MAAAMVGSLVGAGAVAVTPGTPGGGVGEADGESGDGPVTDAPASPGDSPDDPGLVPANASGGVAAFESAAAFREYLWRAPSGDGGRWPSPRLGRQFVTTAGPEVALAAGDAASAGDGATGASEPRYSGTNVQEVGIDEPDLVKGDGERLYYADPGERYWSDGPGTAVIDASDPADPAVAGRVDDAGRMLLVGDRLVVLDGDHVTGYDTTTPAAERVWRRPLNGSVASARLVNGSVYLVVREAVDHRRPCPVEPLGSEGPTVDCSSVYHPTEPAPADATYTVVRVDPATGTVGESVSVVGSRALSATYVSGESVYLTYTRRTPPAELKRQFLLADGRDLLDDRVERGLRRVDGLNVSERARALETRVVLRRWYASMESARRERVVRAVERRFREYLTERRGGLARTGVVAVEVPDLSVRAHGTVPGVALNQFSMDEREGRLRIATTVQTGGRQGGGSANDLYVLNESLSVVGAETDMAPGQRIYAVRYVGDTAYLVTFRRVDPFHVVDLSDPRAPVERGQVELPGFSRYLHPVGEKRLLGVGREDGRVKVVLFDASDPEDPRVVDDLLLETGWSAVSRSHHAFLQDPEHGVAFVPAGETGYVVSYEDGLAVEHRVETDGEAVRARYVDDYLYVFARGQLVVVDERDWEREADLDL